MTDDLTRRVAEVLDKYVLTGVDLELARALLHDDPPKFIMVQDVGPAIAAALRATINATANNLYTVATNCDCDSCAKKKNAALAAGLAALKGVT